MDNEYRRLNITLRTGNYKDELFSATKGLEGIKRIEDYMSRHPKGKMYKWIIVGEPFNFAILMKLILQGQILSVTLTLCIIGLMLTFLFKNWKAGLVSLVPLVISIAVVYGSMAFLGITLDLAKCLLAAIAIGIGIDDTIHMMKTLKYFLTRGLSMDEAISATHKEAGIAIMYTSLALIFYLGWLVAFTMIATTVSALVLLPSVMKFFKVDLRNESKHVIF